MLPSYEGKKWLYEGFAEQSVEDRSRELWQAFEEQPKIMEVITRDHAPWGYDLDDDYKQNQVQWRDRGATGFESEPLMKQIFLDLEMMIEEVIGAKRIKEKKMPMYKGTVKRWQILMMKVSIERKLSRFKQLLEHPYQMSLKCIKRNIANQ